ncbi:MAG TPA: cysteine--tRNA ligase [Candidatus Paceibacterota bacterium]|nr:cysteine--tRNA ligase [Candidatus Paceibacterota bacterium]
MVIRLFNTLTRKKEIFKPIKKGRIRIYTCGPTVYSYQHIGNLRSYIFSDILKRVFFYNKYKVKQVMNITDVGHLTSDADEGEDKIEKAAKCENKKAEDIANYYWNIFRRDFKKLNILEPDIWCKATKHIKEQIELIKKLEKKGYTYRTSDGIYFNTAKFKNYGEIAQLKRQKLQAGKRIDLGEKKNITDFALWKFSPSTLRPGSGPKRQQEWDSPWGIGFPGWHIECSAMSMKYLGEHFDIHTGGIDHIPVHHTNEIAQSEAVTGKKFVNFWMHGEFLNFKGKKVSKSTGGLYTISDLEEKGFNPLAFRYLTFITHYRDPLNFSLESLQSAQDAYLRLKNLVQENKDKRIKKEYLKEFHKAINDDLNMPKALSIIWKILRDKKPARNASKLSCVVGEMDEVLGLDLLKKEEFEIPEQIKKLLLEREQARKNKNWKESDQLRDKIKSLGYLIEDMLSGQKIKKII